MKKNIKTFLFILLLIICSEVFSQENTSESRNALLIANAEYTAFSSLSQPIIEAQELMQSLQTLGFSVTLVENASLEEMRFAIEAFDELLKAKGGIGFFHYGGHAVQVNGRNYLIPSDANIPSEKFVNSRALNLDEIMECMVAETNIVVLDSCRNNPLPAGSGRSATRGLAFSEIKPKNSIIIYSAQAGNVALDGIFTPILTKAILQKDKSLTDVLIDVRKEVYEKTKDSENGPQIPGEYGQLMKQIYLAGRTKIVDESIIQVETKTSVKAVTGFMKITSDIGGKVFLDNIETGTIKSYGSLEIELPTGMTTVEIRGVDNILKKTVIVHADETVIVELNKPVQKMETPQLVEKSPTQINMQTNTQKRPSVFKIDKEKLNGIHFTLNGYYNYSLFNVFDIASFSSSDISLGGRLSPLSLYESGFEFLISVGYSYTESNIDRYEYFFHELDLPIMQLGFNIWRFAFHFGASAVLQFEILNAVENEYIGGMASRWGIGIPIDVLFRLGNNVSLYAGYKPVIFPEDAISRNSFNVGMVVNFKYGG